MYKDINLYTCVYVNACSYIPTDFVNNKAMLFWIFTCRRKNEKYSFKHIVELTSDVDEFRVSLQT